MKDFDKISNMYCIEKKSNCLSERYARLEDNITMNDLVKSIIPLKPKFISYVNKDNSIKIKQKKKLVFNDKKLSYSHIDLEISDQIGVSHLLSEDGNYVRQKTSEDLLKKLKKSYWKTEAVLDLHGLFQNEAKRKILFFLDRSYEENLRCIKIIHGKGYGSYKMQPVLKHMVRIWLIQIEIVQAFSVAPKLEGGTGSLLVLLKKRSKIE